MRKIIVRADDIGYSEVNDIGAFEAIEKGVATAADVMLDAPHAPQALARLREMPWISVGWHAHFWMSPVLPAEKVPTLVQPNGRFRTDLHSAEDVDFAEILAEARAQIEMCIDSLGRVPDTGVGSRGPETPFSKALKQVSEEYGMPVDYMGMRFNGREFPASGRWADRKIMSADLGTAYSALRTTDSDRLLETYDPVSFYTEDKGGILQQPEDVISMCCWHPGYLDWTNFVEGDYGPAAKYYTLCRIIDVHALCSGELHDWIRDNQIELVNFRDAFYGTRSYQNHLRSVGSDLFIG